ncbi:DNA adenine methylase [Corynebacterium diphtheriae]|uniref:DNA adenine methylase n=1 Tax=Corynebacterium diphtheriae TaxID=1717 RepID=UPI0008930EF4|nr:DNA adenine methylase [Corynebacterium diphtheriae]OFI53900.1 DNA methyltransferase [Corynebacterium diphtheriae]OSQ21387.1 DNA methyltransferase [Corynebacterium diphtheriae]CAB0580616.1 DNA methyltransferase [Corynebacterium diphtheriae]CAB0581448.1 DNA methyltransferase [Corynebacterium diphtheriae]CAB0831184.1 DNA methyltransferase [Corynebacterium diphtheriae]
MRFLSPLRYPGGKARLAPFLERIIRAQTPAPSYYAEPFAGGAGAALKLLHTGVVEHIHLNDLNPGIASMWRAILEETNEFLHLVTTTPIDLVEWKRQRDIYQTPIGRDDLELGFATFYLNRTNRSGILNAGPIGGLEQRGNWKIDARFNRTGLIKRIQTIATMKNDISITEMDGLDFLDSLKHLGGELFVYADPPYIVQGEGLYLHAFDEIAHLQLAEKLAEIECPWLLTYDDDHRITDVLYKGGRCATFPIAHTAHKQHVGSEAVIFSKNLELPDMEITAGRIAQWSQ